MTAALSEIRPSVTWIRPWRVAWLAALVAVALLMTFQDAMPWVAKYPKGLIVPLRFWVSDFMKWLINDADLGLFTFKEFTRSIAWLLEWFLDAALGLLAEGFKIPLGGEAFFQIPPLSWVALVLVLPLLAYWIKDRTLAALVGLCLLYLVVFGQWDSAMVTLSSIIVEIGRAHV